ncbi:MAG: Aspartokinase [Hydrogenibacillus schlegelii]|uniref:Aspartokinase n=1 Tax=Hydrogenibacillus schlegelii TaxID=1484 RepID=A0A2T5GBX8_HYDSH|nr:aspartate kinase [Hydrogenibacillus schlegelii]PTQ53694.1 MAG: Aspartokinase [Hydrogenibacillus schlegelii]
MERIPRRVVQKYGGSSLATVEAIRAVAARVARTVREGTEVVLVVSAMGRSTDGLIALASSLHPAPPGRELDLLLATGEIVSASLMAIALHREGVAAEALTGAQAGLITDGTYGGARIVAFNTARIRALLARGAVPVVAGFQGMSASGEVTTLGRGGSDTTAAALAAALGADRCEIYTDVDGVYSADPRRDPASLRFSYLTYEAALRLAENGAKVIHPDAVRWAQSAEIPLVVAKNDASDALAEGTLIASADFRGLPAAEHDLTIIPENVASTRS